MGREEGVFKLSSHSHLLKQAFTHYCHLHEPSLAQQILICCDKILFSHTQRGYQFLFLDYFIIFRFFFFYRNYFIIIILLYIFFYENYVYFFMFRNVPACSGMFHVPCSRFYRRPFQRELKWRHLEQERLRSSFKMA